MKRSCKNILVLFVLTLLISASNGQDVHFTQFYSNPLYLSPSFAGATQQHRVASTYRNQWLGLPKGFSTYSFSYDHYFDNFNSGVGVLFLRDAAGSGNLGTTGASIFYSYDIQFHPLWHLRPGLSFSYLSTGVQFSKLEFSSPTETSPAEYAGDFDAGVSCMVYSPRFWGGFDVAHLMQPNQSLYQDLSKIPVKFSVYGGYQIVQRGRLLQPVEETISLAGLFKHQGQYNQLDVGLYWFKMPMVLGIWYRGIPLLNSPYGDALALLAGFKTKSFSFAYSYDFTISNLISSTNGAHEISLIYEFTVKERKRKIHAIPCPEF